MLDRILLKRADLKYTFLCNFYNNISTKVAFLKII